MTKKYLRIIYPEDRVVPADKIILWAQDDISNKVGMSDFPDITLKQAMRVLEHFGTVTFHKSNPVNSRGIPFASCVKDTRPEWVRRDDPSYDYPDY